MYLGVYIDDVKAAMAYDRAALMLFGDAAVLNVRCLHPTRRSPDLSATLGPHFPLRCP